MKFKIEGDIIKYKSVFIICMALAVFLCVGAVCASDLNQTDDIQSYENDDSQSISLEEDDGLKAESDDTLQANSSAAAQKKIGTTAKTSSGTVFTQNSKYDIQILDEKGNPLSKKLVQVSYKGKVSNLTTNAKGHVYVNLYAKGTYKLTYSFKEVGYAPLKGSKTITITGGTASKIKGSNYVAYAGAKNPFTVTLSTGGIRMPNKNVVFTIKGKSYTKKTDSKGQATLNINLAKGSYTIKYKFKGVTNAKAASGSAKITVKKGMPTRITNQITLNYKANTPEPFTIKYRDIRGDPIPYKSIVFKVNQKTYIVKTAKDGSASFTVNLKKGVYTLKVNSYNTAVYKKSQCTYILKVKGVDDGSKKNGFWLFGSDMKKVNLETVASKGINQIFLNFYAFELYGKGEVSNFVSTARSYGIDVHIWMQAFYKGGWISPVDSNGKYKYSLFNSIIKQAKEYASIDGVAGIHFDYLRFPGTAYKHTNGVAAINYFTKKACSELHALNPDLIVSAAVMPEPSSMKYYYGQDIPTLSKYLDVIVPMVYKGNYGQGTSWIKSVTAKFVSQSNGADVWTGLQGYASDSNVNKLSALTLMNDANHAIMGGALGVIIFRYSLFNFFDFDSL